MDKKNSFEIFGYDFILGENYNSFFFQININIGLEISSLLLNQILPEMIDEAFELTIDEEFSLSSEVIEQESKFPVHYHINSEKNWEKYYY